MFTNSRDGAVNLTRICVAQEPFERREAFASLGVEFGLARKESPRIRARGRPGAGGGRNLLLLRSDQPIQPHR